MKKILLIEDDNIVINILSFLLRKEGYQIHTASNGELGIKKILEIKPDLITTDLLMPFKSGFEVLNFVKQEALSIPVIVISSLGREDKTIEKAFKMGAAALISKPFNPTELLLKVKQLI